MISSMAQCPLQYSHVYHNGPDIMICLRLNCYSFCLVNSYRGLHPYMYAHFVKMHTYTNSLIMHLIVCTYMLNFIAVFSVQTIGHAIRTTWTVRLHVTLLVRVLQLATPPSLKQRISSGITSPLKQLRSVEGFRLNI